MLIIAEFTAYANTPSAVSSISCWLGFVYRKTSLMLTLPLISRNRAEGQGNDERGAVNGGVQLRSLPLLLRFGDIGHGDYPGREATWTTLEEHSLPHSHQLVSIRRQYGLRPRRS